MKLTRAMRMNQNTTVAGPKNKTTSLKTLKRSMELQSWVIIFCTFVSMNDPFHIQVVKRFIVHCIIIDYSCKTGNLRMSQWTLKL